MNALRSPDLDSSGFGLRRVQALSERWGLDRLAQGGASVLAQLPRAPAPTDEPGERCGARPFVIRFNKPAGGRQTPAGGQP